MKRERLQRINAVCFAIILLSVVCGLAVGIAGIWQYIGTEDALLWKLLGTCGAVFFAAMTASMAIAWFKSNE